MSKIQDLKSAYYVFEKHLDRKDNLILLRSLWRIIEEIEKEREIKLIKARARLARKQILSK